MVADLSFALIIETAKDLINRVSEAETTQEKCVIGVELLQFYMREDVFQRLILDHEKFRNTVRKKCIEWLVYKKSTDQLKDYSLEMLVKLDNQLAV